MPSVWEVDVQRMQKWARERSEAWPSSSIQRREGAVGFAKGPLAGSKRFERGGERRGVDNAVSVMGAWLVEEPLIGLEM